MRIQFYVNDEEYLSLQARAAESGYPNVASFCKETMLKRRTYADLWQTVRDRIALIGSGNTFALRDLVDVPPAKLGVDLINNQDSLGIQVIKKDHLNTNVFLKL